MGNCAGKPARETKVVNKNTANGKLELNERTKSYQRKDFNTSTSTSTTQQTITKQQTVTHRIVKTQVNTTNKLSTNSVNSLSQSSPGTADLQSLFNTTFTQNADPRQTSRFRSIQEGTYKPVYDRHVFGDSNIYKNDNNKTPKATNAIKWQPVQNKSIDGKRKISVKKCDKMILKNDKVPMYNTSGKHRGYILLINNIKFLDNTAQERRGAEIDEQNLCELFRQLGFEITKFRNLKANIMMKKLEDFASSRGLSNSDMCFVIIMTHGNGDRAGMTSVCGIDNVSILVPDILEKFSNANCRSMIGKPKIFIFQSCRGNEEQAVEVDAAPIQKSQTSVIKDTLVAYSTLPGFTSHRSVEYGTWYIQALCTVFMEHACDTHIEDMLKIVAKQMNHNDSFYSNRIQTSSYENRGFKACYLNPK